MGREKVSAGGAWGAAVVAMALVGAIAGVAGKIGCIDTGAGNFGDWSLGQ